MFVRAEVVGAFLLVILAGCASPPQSTRRAPDWSLTPSSGTGPATRPGTASPRPPAPASAQPLSPQESPGAQVSNNWVPLDRWCRAQGMAPVSTRWNGPTAEFMTSSPQGALLLRAGSRIARWKDFDLHLGFAPALANNTVLVHNLELRKTILPLLSGTLPGAEVTNRVVVIDPGHGGRDVGTKSILGAHYEKEYTLDWGRRLAQLLTERGCRVVLTRSTDTELSITNRVAVADRCDSALFLSLHFNASGLDGVPGGIETYCLTPAGMPSTFTRGFDDDLAQVYPNNAFDAENLRLASSVHGDLLRVSGVHDRGLRRARFLSVLRTQRRPAVLVEGGYLSNPAEARLISQPEYRQQLARALADAVLRYFSGRPASLVATQRD